MSTPESTVETSDLDTSARAKQDKLTESVGRRLAVPSSDGKAPWWKRLLGRS
jgi:hypothetical protein